MPVSIPARIVEPFGKNAGGSYINLPIPVASQIGIVDGAASFNDGFPPRNFILAEAGGIPPAGKDFNGLLYMITAYCAMLQAGQTIGYDAPTQAAIAGYALGARLQQAGNLGAHWVSTVAGNMTNPDTGGAGWVSTVPLYFDDATLGGTTANNYALPGASDYALDIDTTAGNVAITGIVAQRDGQRLVVSNIGANTLTLDGLNAGSAAANRIRSLGDYPISQNGSITIQYFSGVSKWLIV